MSGWLWPQLQAGGARRQGLCQHPGQAAPRPVDHERRRAVLSSRSHAARRVRLVARPPRASSRQSRAHMSQLPVLRSDLEAQHRIQSCVSLVWQRGVQGRASLRVHTRITDPWLHFKASPTRMAIAKGLPYEARYATDWVWHRGLESDSPAVRARVFDVIYNLAVHAELLYPTQADTFVLQMQVGPCAVCVAQLHNSCWEMGDECPLAMTLLAL